MEYRSRQKLGVSLIFVLSQVGALVALDRQLELIPRVEVGQRAPSFELLSVDRSTHSLASLHDKSALILVFFRGAW